MLARILLFAAILSPLYGQDEEVTKYLVELRTPKAPHDVTADLQQLLVSLRHQLDQNNTPDQNASLYLGIGDIEQMLHDSDAAIAAARIAHDLVPADDRVALALANVLVWNRQTAEVPALLGVDPSDGAAVLLKAQSLGTGHAAEFLAELAHGLLPGDPKAADSLGQIYLRQGATKQASDAFHAAAALAPQVATYHYHLGLASLQSGNRDQAESELRQALDSNPTETERDSIRNTLDRLNVQVRKE